MIDQETIDKFAEYLHLEPMWGVFHVSLDDGNWDFDASLACLDNEELAEQPPNVLELIDIHNNLSSEDREQLSIAVEKRMPELYEPGIIIDGFTIVPFDEA